MPSFWQAQIMTKEAIFDLTGREIDPDLLTVHPTGNLIHVLCEEAPRRYGSLHIPDMSVGSGEQMGVGWIIAAGPRAGHPDFATSGPTPSGVMWEWADPEAGPKDLLGLHVIFGSHTGMPLRVDLLDTEFKSAVLVMKSMDIRGVDTNPKSLTSRAEEKSQRGEE